MPIHTDPNFTGPLFSGLTYLWRGAAFEYIFSADYTISLTHVAPYHLIYLGGPLHNITVITGRTWIVYPVGGRPLYAVRQRVYFPNGRFWSDAILVYKLEDITPDNTTIPFTILIPRMFSRITEELTEREDRVLRAVVSGIDFYRVIGMELNSTHIIYKLAHTRFANYETVAVVAISSSPISGKTIKITNNPVRGSYVVSGASFPFMALPYLHFVITPTETTTLTIYVN
jgi:hypothetical protein